MVKINKLITKVNYTPLTNKRNMWIVIHYVGAVSTAKANALYFEKINRKASASYFVDANSIWQCVEDTDGAWHVGGASKYYNSCRNNNSIGIELCCKKQNGIWYFEQGTIDNAIALTKYLMQKYNIPIERVCRHYDVTHKICPEPFVKNEVLWLNFLKEVQKMDNVETEKELTIQDKCKVIQEYYGLDENTTLYFQFYRYNVALIDKLYYKAKNGLK